MPGLWRRGTALERFASALAVVAAVALAGTALVAVRQPWTWTVLPVAALTVLANLGGTSWSMSFGHGEWYDLDEVAFVVALVLLPLPLAVLTSAVVALGVALLEYRHSRVATAVNAWEAVLMPACCGLLLTALHPGSALPVVAAAATFAFYELFGHPVTTMASALQRGARPELRSLPGCRASASWLPALVVAGAAAVAGTYAQRWGVAVLAPLVAVVGLFALVSRSRLASQEQAVRLSRTLRLATDLQVAARTDLVLEQLARALDDLVGIGGVRVLDASEVQPGPVPLLQHPLPPRTPGGAGRLLVAERPHETRGSLTPWTEVATTVLAVGARGLLAVEARSDLEHGLAHDALTGLLNRAGFLAAADDELARAARSGHRSVLLYIDLDGFKAVNDELGHSAGDACLQHAAGVLRAATRPHDLVSRLGGDEFAVLVVDVEPEQDGVEVADRLRGLLEQGWRCGPESELAVSGTVGRAAFPDDGADLTALLDRADADMYGRKRQR